MTRNYRSWLGTLLFLWLGLGLTATTQTLPQPAEVIGPYNCSAPRVTKLKFIFLSKGRWVNGPIFNPAAFKMRWVPVTIRSYGSKMLLAARDPAQSGEFRVEKDRVTLYPPRTRLGFLNQFDPDVSMAVQQFRIDPVSGDLTEVRLLGAFRPLLTCTRDGFF